MPLLLWPLLGGGAVGFAAGSWTSGLIGNLLKLGLLGTFLYFVLIKM